MGNKGNYIGHGKTGGKSIGQVMRDILNYKEKFADHDLEPDQKAVVREQAEMIMNRLGRKATFTEKDIKREVAKAIEEASKAGVAEIEFDAHVTAVVRHLSVNLGKDPLSNELTYTSNKSIKAEWNLLANAIEQDGSHAMSQRDFELSISRLEAAATKRNKSPFKVSDEQRSAVETTLLSTNRISIIEGVPGAGKSTVSEALVLAYKDKGYETIGVALSHQAKDNLMKTVHRADSEAEGTVVAQLLIDLRNGKLVLDPKTLILIDEAGLISAADLEELTTFARKAGAKVVMLGDRKQLTPVAGTSGLTLIADHQDRNNIKCAILTEIRRQENPDDRQAVIDIRNGDAIKALRSHLNRGNVTFVRGDKDPVAVAVEKYFASEHKSKAIICYTNLEGRAVNAQIQEQMVANGTLKGEPLTMKINDGKGPHESNFYIGDRVVFRKTIKMKDLNGEDIEVSGDEADYDFSADTGKLTNRTAGTVIGTALVGDEPALKIQTDDGRILVINEKNYSHNEGGCALQLGYAMTVYASQGLDIDYVTALGNENEGVREGLVHLSRHKKGIDIILAAEGLTDDQAIEMYGEAWSKDRYQGSVMDFVHKTDMTEDQVRAAMVQADINAQDDGMPIFAAKVEEGERYSWFGNCPDQEGAAEFMVALAESNPLARDPAYHFTCSWSTGQVPTREQVDEAAKIFLKKMGMEHQPYKVGWHLDTDNVHFHLVVAKTDLFTGKQHIVPFAQLQAMQAAAMVAYKQGWGVYDENERYVVDERGLVDLHLEKVASLEKSELKTNTGRGDRVDPGKAFVLANKQNVDDWLNGNRDRLYDEVLKKRGKEVEIPGEVVNVGAMRDRVLEKDLFHKIEATVGENRQAIAIGPKLNQKQRDLEHKSGQKSAVRIATEHLDRIIEKSRSWTEFHLYAAEQGIAVSNRTSGFKGFGVTVHFADGEKVSLSGSQVGVRARTMSKFGVFENSIHEVVPAQRQASRKVDEKLAGKVTLLAEKRSQIRQNNEREETELKARQEKEVEDRRKLVERAAAEQQAALQAIFNAEKENEYEQQQRDGRSVSVDGFDDGYGRDSGADAGAEAVGISGVESLSAQPGGQGDHVGASEEEILSSYDRLPSPSAMRAVLARRRHRDSLREMRAERGVEFGRGNGEAQGVVQDEDGRYSGKEPSMAGGVRRGLQSHSTTEEIMAGQHKAERQSLRSRHVESMRTLNGIESDIRAAQGMLSGARLPKRRAFNTLEQDIFFAEAYLHYRRALPSGIKNREQVIDQRVAMAAAHSGMSPDDIATMITRNSEISDISYGNFVAKFPTSSLGRQIAKAEREAGILFNAASKAPAIKSRDVRITKQDLDAFKPVDKQPAPADRNRDRSNEIER